MQREVVLIFGQTGSGKTSEAIRLLQGYPRALIAEANFGEFPAAQFQEFEDLLLHLEERKAFSDAGRGYWSSSPFRASYSPRSNEHPLIFDAALELGNLHLILEEADRFDDPRSFPEYDEVITRGRHYGVHIVALGLHPFKLPPELRRQATTVISFRQIDPRDVGYIAEIIGETAEELPSLAPFEKILWTPQEGAKRIPSTVVPGSVNVPPKTLG